MGSRITRNPEHYPPRSTHDTYTGSARLAVTTACIEMVDEVHTSLVKVAVQI